MTERIANALQALCHTATPTNFACRLTLPIDALRLAVDEVGDIELPVPTAQARALADISRPAPFGLGERTLLDTGVRDVGEIAKRRVHVDTRHWKRHLAPALECIREELGLPDGTLEARLHKLLVYEKGQFFLPHRDTERDDDMVGTLVVVLPSTHRGGTLTVEHKGETRRFVAPRANAAPALTLLAFYADCVHEVKPVTAGTRITLSYQLHFTPAVRAAASITPVSMEAGLESLVGAVREYFDERATMPGKNAHYSRSRTDRLVCLLDHEYSSRSLAWPRLKGEDGLYALGLRYAAVALDLRPWLVHAEIDETWSAQDDGGGDIELEELLDRGAALEGWRDASSEPRDFPTVRVWDGELCRFEELANSEPESEEYEGWMGNYGDTLERRYRRSAIVLWPARCHSRVLLGMGAKVLLRELLDDTADGDEKALAAARTALHAILDDWMPLGPSADRETFAAALALCARLGDPSLAAEILSGFRLVAVAPREMPTLLALGERLGPEFRRTLTAGWSAATLSPTERHHATMLARAGRAEPGTRSESARQRLEGANAFRALCEQVRRAEGEGEGGGGVWTRFLPVLFDSLHAALREVHAAQHASERPSERDRDATPEGRQLVALFDAARAMDDEGAAVRLLDTLRESIEGYRPEVPAAVIEHAAGDDGERSGAPPSRALKASIDALRRRTVEALHAALVRSAREPGDWRIDTDLGCRCADCRTLAVFLAASDEHTLDLPLAKDRRAHLHGRIDARELPVSHTTRRQGRPYTLELRKRRTLFTRDARRHELEKGLLARVETLKSDTDTTR